jgi:FixJ family two-component response regulator
VNRGARHRTSQTLSIPARDLREAAANFLEDDGFAHVPAQTIKHTQMARTKSRVAVVDDDAAVRKALKRLLETSSYQVQTFEAACELISALSHVIPACIIVDLQMPNMSALELQHHLARSGIEIPTIVMTAHDEPGTRERCIAAGAVAYLLKPLRKAVLIAAIETAIGRSAARGTPA